MRTATTPTVRRANTRQAAVGQRVARAITRPAPVGGWNRRDSLAMMRPEDAVKLDNFFPGEGRVDLRAGYASHATGVAAPDSAIVFS